MPRIAWNSSKTLTLHAYRNIEINADIQYHDG